MPILGLVERRLRTREFLASRHEVLVERVELCDVLRQNCLEL